MSEKTIREILGDFGPAKAPDKKSLKGGRAVTIWLPADAKARYDRLQERSGKLFGKKAREVLMELIDGAEELIA